MERMPCKIKLNNGGLHYYTQHYFKKQMHLAAMILGVYLLHKSYTIIACGTTLFMAKQPYRYKLYLKCYFLQLFIMAGCVCSFAQKKEGISTSIGEVKASIEHRNDSCSLCCLHAIQFDEGSKKLTKQARLVLDSIVHLLIMHPSYHMEVAFWEAMHCFPKRGEKRVPAFIRVNEIATYVIKKGIDENRVAFAYRGDIPEIEPIMYLKLTNASINIIPPPPAPSFRNNEH